LRRRDGTGPERIDAALESAAFKRAAQHMAGIRYRPDPPIGTNDATGG